MERSTRLPSNVSDAKSFSQVNKASLHASNNYQNAKISKKDKSKSASHVNKPVRILTTKSSIKPVRVLAKTASFKSKRSAARKWSGVSKFSDMNRATCSSVLRGSKLTDHVQLQQDGDEPKGTDVIKVCTYSFCSLHGHRHATGNSLKRFPSIKQRQQKSRKQKNQPPQHSGNISKSIQAGNLIAATMESTVINCMTPSASINFPMDKPTSNGEKNGFRTLSYELPKESLLHGEPEVGSTTDVEDDAWLGKQKYLTLWRLIYQHSVSNSIAENEPKLPLDKESEARQEQNASKLLRIVNAAPYQGTEEDTDPDIGNINAGEQESDLNQSDAIRLVNEAIDSILNQEAESQSSDGKSITSSITSEQKLLENKIEDGEPSISTFIDPASHKLGENEQTKRECSVMQKPETWIIKEDAKLSYEGNISNNKKMSKSWSKLKKLIVLQRFIKKKERMENFTPGYMSLDSHPKSEKVYLRPQTIEERKNSEEYLLDHALRQVVSKLDAAKKKKVALLVAAFETFNPTIDTGTSWRADGTSTPANHIQADSDPLVKSNRETKKGDFDGDLKIMLIDRTSIPEKSADVNQHFVGESLLSEQHNNIRPSELQQTKSECYDIKQDECTVASGDNNTDWSKDGKQEEAKPEYGSIQGSPSVNEGELESHIDVADESRLESQNQRRLWHLIYKNMVSDIAAKDGTQPLHDGTLYEDCKDNSRSSSELNSSGSCQVSSEVGHMDMKHQNENSQNTEFRKLEAVKLVKEAIEKILLPEIDSPLSDEQSITNNIITRQGLLDMKSGQVEPFNASFAIHVEVSFNKSANALSAPEEMRSASCYNDNQEDEENTGRKVVHNTKQKKPNSWSNLKKLILLKKFIKALEKVRKFNPREPKYLPLEPDPEAEKVNLEHQNKDERKAYEEWMIDYALQQVVSQLEPDQKRKVKLLVEAFETVMSTI